MGAYMFIYIYIYIYINYVFSFVAITGDKITTDVQYDEGNLACLNESVTYFCTVTDALRLDWIIPPMITSSDPIRFLASNTVGLTDSKGQFNGNLTSLNASLSDPNRANITSTLSFVAYTSLNGSLIECLSDVSRVMSIVFITGTYSVYKKCYVACVTRSRKRGPFICGYIKLVCMHTLRTHLMKTVRSKRRVTVPCDFALITS